MSEIELRYFEKGQELFAAGAPGGILPKLCSGAAILYAILDDGRRQIIDLAGPGDLLHFETDGETDYFAEALTPCEIVCLPADELSADPAFQLYFVEQMRERLAAERRHITLLGRRSARERVLDFLNFLADFFDSAPDEIALPMTRQQVADYLGLTLETVSRIFAQWLRENRLVEVEPHVYRLRVDDEGTSEPLKTGKANARSRDSLIRLRAA